MKRVMTPLILGGSGCSDRFDFGDMVTQLTESIDNVWAKEWRDRSSPGVNGSAKNRKRVSKSHKKVIRKIAKGIPS